MVGTPINLVRGLIKLGLIKDLNLAITVRRPLEWLKKGLKERWSCRELNPGPLAYRASALPLSYNSCQRGVVAGGSCSLVAEHWHGKPKALGSIPGSSIFLSSPFSAIPKVYGQ